MEGVCFRDQRGVLRGTFILRSHLMMSARALVCRMEVGKHSGLEMGVRVSV